MRMFLNTLIGMTAAAAVLVAGMLMLPPVSYVIPLAESALPLAGSMIVGMVMAVAYIVAPKALHVAVDSIAAMYELATLKYATWFNHAIMRDRRKIREDQQAIQRLHKSFADLTHLPADRYANRAV